MQGDELRLRYLGDLQEPWSGVGHVVKIPDSILCVNIKYSMEFTKIIQELATLTRALFISYFSLIFLCCCPWEKFEFCLLLSLLFLFIRPIQGTTNKLQ